MGKHTGIIPEKEKKTVGKKKRKKIIHIYK